LCQGSTTFLRIFRRSTVAWALCGWSQKSAAVIFILISEISRSWASRSKIPPYLLELFLEIRKAVLECSNFFFHKLSSVLKEGWIYNRKRAPLKHFRTTEGVRR